MTTPTTRAGWWCRYYVTIDGQLLDWDAVVRDAQGCASTGDAYTVRFTTISVAPTST